MPIVEIKHPNGGPPARVHFDLPPTGADIDEASAALFQGIPGLVRTPGRPNSTVPTSHARSVGSKSSAPLPQTGGIPGLPSQPSILDRLNAITPGTPEYNQEHPMAKRPAPATPHTNPAPSRPPVISSLSPQQLAAKGLQRARPGAMTPGRITNAFDIPGVPGGAQIVRDDGTGRYDKSKPTVLIGNSGAAQYFPPGSNQPTLALGPDGNIITWRQHQQMQTGGIVPGGSAKQQGGSPSTVPGQASATRAMTGNIHRTPVPGSLDELMSLDNRIKNTMRVGMGNPALNGIPNSPIWRDAQKLGDVVSRPVFSKGYNAFTAATFANSPYPRFYDYLGRPMPVSDPRVQKYIGATHPSDSLLSSDVWLAPADEAVQQTYGVPGDKRSPFASEAGAISESTKAAMEQIPGLQPLAPGQKVTKAQRALHSLPGAAGGLLAGFVDGGPLALETLTKGAISRVSPEANRSYNEDIEGASNSFGMGADGQLTKLRQGHVVEAIQQTIDKIEEDPATAVATAFGGYLLLKGISTVGRVGYRNYLTARSKYWNDERIRLQDEGDTAGAAKAAKRSTAFKEASNAITQKLIAEASQPTLVKRVVSGASNKLQQVRNQKLAQSPTEPSPETQRPAVIPQPAQPLKQNVPNILDQQRQPAKQATTEPPVKPGPTPPSALDEPLIVQETASNGASASPAEAPSVSEAADNANASRKPINHPDATPAQNAAANDNPSHMETPGHSRKFRFQMDDHPWIDKQGEPIHPPDVTRIWSKTGRQTWSVEDEPQASNALVQRIAAESEGSSVSRPNATEEVPSLLGDPRPGKLSRRDVEAIRDAATQSQQNDYGIALKRIAKMMGETNVSWHTDPADFVNKIVAQGTNKGMMALIKGIGSKDTGLTEMEPAIQELVRIKAGEYWRDQQAEAAARGDKAAANQAKAAAETMEDRAQYWRSMRTSVNQGSGRGISISSQKTRGISQANAYLDTLAEQAARKRAAIRDVSGNVQVGVAELTPRVVSLQNGKVVASTHNVGVTDASGGLLPDVRYQVVGMVDSPTGAMRTVEPGANVWRVLDRKTGRFITEASTRHEAIADATQRVHADATGAEQKPALSHIYAPLEIAHPEVFDLFGHIIDASGYDNCSNGSKMIIHQYFNDLRLIPRDIAQKVMNLRMNGMYFGEGPVPELDAMQHLRGKHPRGTPEGTTWDDEVILGCYSGNGTSGQIIVAAPKSMANKGFSRIFSPPLHEFGHALGHMLRYNYDKELIAAHIRLYDTLPEYLQQDGPGTLGGREELLADGVAAVLKDPVAAVAEYDQDFVSFIQNVVLKGGQVISEKSEFPRPPGSRP